MEPPRSISVDGRASEPGYRFGAWPQPASAVGEPARPVSGPPRGSALPVPGPALAR